jgi:antirestriction protein ArdC
MGAAFLAAEAGIDVPAVRENEAAYVRHWMDAIKGDPRMVVVAAGAAQKAADHILGRKHGNPKKEDEE